MKSACNQENVSPRVNSINGKSKLSALFLAVASLGLFSVSLHATTEDIFYDSGYSANASTTIDLNTYSSTEIQSLVVYVWAGSDSPSTDDYCSAYANVSIVGGMDGGNWSDSHNGNGSASASLLVTISNIIKDGNGHWIAGSVESSEWGFYTRYNVDLGTGSIYIQADAGGLNYSWASASAYIVY